MAWVVDPTGIQKEKREKSKWVWDGLELYNDGEQRFKLGIKGWASLG